MPLVDAVSPVDPIAKQNLPLRRTCPFLRLFFLRALFLSLFGDRAERDKGPANADKKSPSQRVRFLAGAAEHKNHKRACE